MRKRNILILDCTPKSEPSEGELLWQFFQICRLHKPAKATPLFYKVRSKKEFISKLNTGTKYNIIHIAAHGTSEGLGNGRTWVAKPEEIKETNHKATLIHASACLANKAAMAEAFHGSKYFLAPKTRIDWIDAALFSLMFYKRYIVDGIQMRNAFEYARRRTQTTKDYPEYWW